MALVAMLDSVDALSEELRKEYKKRDDGKWVLEVTPVGGLELSDTAGLKTALGKERANAKTAAEKLVAFGELDPAAAKAALAKVKEMADWDPEKKVAEKVQAREKQLIEKHEAAVAALEKERDSVSTELQRNLITNTAITALQSAKGSVKLLLPHVERQAKMRRTETGQFAVDVIGADGNPRVGDSAGNPMTIAQLVEELKGSKDFAAAFEGAGATGSGTAGGGGTKVPAEPAKGTLRIDATDQEALNANVEKIASGEAVVVP